MKNSITIDSVEDILEILSKHRKSSNIKYRGQSKKEWQLIPKAGRPPFNLRDDQNLFGQWKRRAIAYIDKENHTEWEWLAIAQHTGVPTRLLDWTHNPLVAIFFACIENLESDGSLFIYKPKALYNISQNTPFKIEKDTVKFFQPSASSNRIINQFGYFSIHNQPSLEMTEKTTDGKLERIVIKSEIKKDIIFMLNQFGINNLTIFPDLEGLAKHLTWFYENYEHWDGSIPVE